MKDYVKICKVGEGSHGTIYKCKKKASNIEQQKFYSIKKMKKMKNYKTIGLGPQIIREIMHIQELNHPYIIKVYDFFTKNNNIYIVFEYMETNLEKIIKDKNKQLSKFQIKQYMKMILQSVEWCHKNWVLHRDIKPSNFLISQFGELKLADFGLAKSFGNPDITFSPEACTIWYRAPELLFGAKYYGPSMDMWSVGCIFGEMLLRKVVFPGNDTVISQLSAIFSVLGTPTEENWMNVKYLPYYFEFDKIQPIPLSQFFPNLSNVERDLFSRICALDPLKRLSAKEALKHPYFYDVS